MQIKFLKISQIVNKTGDNNMETNHQEYCALFLKHPSGPES